MFCSLYHRRRSEFFHQASVSSSHVCSSEEKSSIRRQARRLNSKILFGLKSKIFYKWWFTGLLSKQILRIQNRKFPATKKKSFRARPKVIPSTLTCHSCIWFWSALFIFVFGTAEEWHSMYFLCFNSSFLGKDIEGFPLK